MRVSHPSYASENRKHAFAGAPFEAAPWEHPPRSQWWLHGVLLCFNDGDFLLEDSIRSLFKQNDHAIACDPGLPGETDLVFQRFGHELLETRFHRENLSFMNLFELFGYVPPPFEMLCCEL